MKIWREYRVFWVTGEVGRKAHYEFWYYVILVVVVLSGFAVRNLLRTRYGRNQDRTRKRGDANGAAPASSGRGNLRT